MVKLYPDESMGVKINQNIGNTCLVWKKLLHGYQETFELFKKQRIYKVTMQHKTFNTMTYGKYSKQLI